MTLQQAAGSLQPQGFFIPLNMHSQMGFITAKDSTLFVFIFYK